MTPLKHVAFLFRVTGSNKWEHRAEFTLGGATSQRQTVGLFPVFCDKKYLVQVSKGPCSWECPLYFLVPDSFYSIGASLVRLGTDRVLQITWKWFGGHVGNGDGARRGRSWTLLQKEIWYLHCWFWSTKEPVSVPGVPKNQVVSEYSALLNKHSFLPIFYRWKGPCDHKDRDANSYPVKDSKLCLIAFESQWEISYSFRISNPPRNKCQLDYSTH